MFKSVSLVLIFIISLMLNSVITEKSSSTSPTPSSMKTILYNSSDLSYLSNGIQFPVQAPLETDSVNNDNEKMPELKWLTTLFDHHEWESRLSVLKNRNCTDDMKVYIDNLRNGSSWATKMYDASGRYSDQFFFGNDYWLGSYTLCWDLVKSEYHAEVPPFNLHFYMAKLRININKVLTPVTRQINVGQCLPKSCNVDDIRKLLAQEKSQATSLTVIDVRAIPGSYSIVEDVKFHIIGGVTLAAIVLIIFSSIVEICLNKQNGKVDVESSSSNNNNNNINNNNSSSNGKSYEEGNGSPRKELDETKKQIQRKGTFLRVLLSFSAITNGKKILSFDKPSNDSIGCLHGLRFFSILWIIMVHTYLNVFAISDNKTFRTVTERSYLYQTVSNATYSVDTFFFISGLLVTITYFRTSIKTKQSNVTDDVKNKRIITAEMFRFVTLILYRFLRLTPAYLFAIGLNELILSYTHNNSVFSPAIYDHVTCAKYWWRNALYVNNFYPQREFCMLWSWYLANDMQFYIIAVVLLMFAVRGLKQLKWICGVMITFLITSWITTFVIAMQYNYIARVEEPFALFDQLYDKPWSRIGPYLIGMFTGYILFRYDKRNVNWLIALTGWLSSLSCLISLVYGLGNDGLVVPLSAIYASLGHTAWGLSLAWITISCYWGFGGPVNAILRFRGFFPLSRLTFCAYLVHPIVMIAISFRLDGPLHLHNLNVLVIFFGNAILSFMTAFLISICFEAPVMNILKILFASNGRKK